MDLLGEIVPNSGKPERKGPALSWDCGMVGRAFAEDLRLRPGTYGVFRQLDWALSSCGKRRNNCSVWSVSVKAGALIIEHFLVSGFHLLFDATKRGKTPWLTAETDSQFGQACESWPITTATLSPNHNCADSAPEKRLSAAFLSRMFWLLFCLVGGSGDTSSIFIYSPCFTHLRVKTGIKTIWGFTA